MKITYISHAAFKISARAQVSASSPRETVTIVTDPYTKTLGLSFPSTEADILLVSHDHDDHNAIDKIKGDPFIVTEPGEYESKGVVIEGFTAFHDAKDGTERGRVTQYIITVEDMRIVFLSDFGQKELSNNQLESIGIADILILPVGGTYTIGPKEAVNVINQIEPRIVIPMHYKRKELSLNLKYSVKDFLKEVGGSAETVETFTVTSSSLPQDETKIIVLATKV